MWCASPRRRPAVKNGAATGVLRTTLGWPRIPRPFLSASSLSHKSKLVGRRPSSTASSARRGVRLRKKLFYDSNRSLSNAAPCNSPNSSGSGRNHRRRCPTRPCYQHRRRLQHHRQHWAPRRRPAVKDGAATGVFRTTLGWPRSNRHA